eukprot:3173428-Prymnesium_polylepis.1
MQHAHSRADRDFSRVPLGSDFVGPRFAVDSLGGASVSIHGARAQRQITPHSSQDVTPELMELA